MSDAKMPDQKKLEVTRHRSPNYPAINLEKAVARAEDLYKAFKRNAVPAAVAQEKWGYKAGSGLGRQTVAALKAFGVIDTQGSGDDQHIKISEEAFDAIILNGPRKQQILRAMALKPPVHAKIWAKYEADGLPEDTSAVRYFLIKDLDFNEASVDAFVEQFKATLAYAKINAGDSLTIEVPDINESNQEGKTVIERERQASGPAGAVVITTTATEIPLFLDEGKYVKIPYPLTEDDFSLLLDQLNSLKKRLVKSPVPQPPQS
jgi:hypothetical protein